MALTLLLLLGGLLWVLASCWAVNRLITWLDKR